MNLRNAATEAFVRQPHVPRAREVQPTTRTAKFPSLAYKDGKNIPLCLLQVPCAN